MLAGFVGNFILMLLNSAQTARPICKPLPGEISVQNIPQGPVYPAGFAGYITLGFLLPVALGGPTMKKIRLAWEPVNKCPIEEIEEIVANLIKGKSDGVTLLKNGTLLFIKDAADDVQSAKNCIEEVKFLTDFRVMDFPQGGALVKLHSAVAVYVGKIEFDSLSHEIEERLDDLKFPSEAFLGISEKRHILIGAYARGKLQYDAYNFGFYKRIHGA